MRKLGRSALRRLDENLEAVMREMGVTFALKDNRGRGRKPWECDMLPQIFTDQEWTLLERALQQRLRAFELFLQDVYGPRNILHAGVLPVQVVLGSPFYQRPACHLPRTDNAFLHLTGMAVTRTSEGSFAVRHHYFGSASGISYMMQNRRALARVIPRLFEGYNPRSIADAPTEIVELLRSRARTAEDIVVLLSPGEGSPAYSEHSFLGRRMGIPVVQGQDLVVHGDRLFLKTINGLEPVAAVYSRVADPWLDPLVFRPDSLIGVPGLVQCIRQGTVRMINSIGSQLADDRALLAFSHRIIRFYLNESPLLPSVPTYWLGDLDQRQEVIENLENFCIRPLYGERILTPPPGTPLTPSRKKALLRELHRHSTLYVAQPIAGESATLCFPRGVPTPRLQDHIVFALRKGELSYEAFPGALTRVSTESSSYVASELGGGSKDTWVLSPAQDPLCPSELARFNETRPPASHITSRVADAFYWTGRYLERASSLATMIATIEALELEELNATEQKLCQPLWNQMLPPLENPTPDSRRSISSTEGRYRLALDPTESGSVIHSVRRALDNTDSIQESLSVEAVAVASELGTLFNRIRYQERLTEERRQAVSRRVCERARSLIAEFFGMAEATMVRDGGWRFCLAGQALERAIITANALCTITSAIVNLPDTRRVEHALEIRLSAFLRLLASRDAYRRIYQMRVEPGHAVEMLWNHPAVPRSVRCCLSECLRLLDGCFSADSPALKKTSSEIASLLSTLGMTNWREQFDTPFTGHNPAAKSLVENSKAFLSGLLRLHNVFTDGFLNHQIHFRQQAAQLQNSPSQN